MLQVAVAAVQGARLERDIDGDEARHRGRSRRRWCAGCAPSTAARIPLRRRARHGRGRAGRLHERVVGGQPWHVRLGDAAAQVDEPEVARQRAVLERREGDDLRARVLEQLEILRVVEAERVVEGDADAHRLRAPRRSARARSGAHRWAPGHEPLDEVEVAVPRHRLAELIDRLVDVRVLQKGAARCAAPGCAPTGCGAAHRAPACGRVTTPRPRRRGAGSRWERC